nr:hypothetical protein [Rhodococcus sp. (in: high G+C Gram-positive bacteria)]
MYTEKIEISWSAVVSGLGHVFHKLDIPIEKILGEGVIEDGRPGVQYPDSRMTEVVEEFARAALTHDCSVDVIDKLQDFGR